MPKLVTTDQVAIGRKLYELRRERKLSQGQIGEILNVSYQQVQRYEKGLARISTDGIQKLSRHFGLPVVYFFTDPLKPGKNTNQETLEELMETYLKIKDPKLRTELLNFAKALASNQSHPK